MWCTREEEGMDKEDIGAGGGEAVMMVALTQSVEIKFNYNNYS